MDLTNGQQPFQIDDLINCVLNKSQRVLGEMGLRDMKILMAISEAAQTVKPVKLNP